MPHSSSLGEMVTCHCWLFIFISDFEKNADSPNTQRIHCGRYSSFPLRIAEKYAVTSPFNIRVSRYLVLAQSVAIPCGRKWTTDIRAIHRIHIIPNSNAIENTDGKWSNIMSPPNTIILPLIAEKKFVDQSEYRQLERQWEIQQTRRCPNARRPSTSAFWGPLDLVLGYRVRAGNIQL